MAAKSRKVIITCAVTGSIHTPSMSPYLPVTPQQMLAVLHTYLALLPDHPQQAWTLLTPAEQARSGGFGKYQQTWQAVAQVQLDGAVPHGGNAVLARIKLSTNQGSTTDDFYNVQFVSQNGSVLITDFSIAGHAGRHG